MEIPEFVELQKNIQELPQNRGPDWGKNCNELAHTAFLKCMDIYYFCLICQRWSTITNSHYGGDCHYNWVTFKYNFPEGNFDTRHHYCEKCQRNVEGAVEKHCNQCGFCHTKEAYYCPTCNKCRPKGYYHHCEKCHECGPFREMKHCDQCGKCVPENAIHCDQCQKCVSYWSKDYRHCTQCGKCHSSKDPHCSKCQQCHKEDHLLEYCLKCGSCHLPCKDRYCTRCQCCHYEYYDPCEHCSQCHINKERFRELGYWYSCKCKEHSRYSKEEDPPTVKYCQKCDKCVDSMHSCFGDGVPKDRIKIYKWDDPDESEYE